MSVVQVVHDSECPDSHGASLQRNGPGVKISSALVGHLLVGLGFASFPQCTANRLEQVLQGIGFRKVDALVLLIGEPTRLFVAVSAVAPARQLNAQGERSVRA